MAMALISSLAKGFAWSANAKRYQDSGGGGFSGAPAAHFGHSPASLSWSR
jgi:hypothetical protein